ncbi:MAG: hypothetical protein C0408_04535, partial [Odoribacter sp.]|nr:hypothetical protein [Odoribacter sp.]
MKKLIFGLAIAVVTLTACNNISNKSDERQNAGKNTQVISQSGSSASDISSVIDTKSTVSIKEIVSSYLIMKNALTEDNSNEAAKAGEALKTAFNDFNKTTLTEVQRKTFEDVEADAMENAEHIAENGENIAHQREHFVMLSKDMYDLVKTFGSEQVLYKVF